MKKHQFLSKFIWFQSPYSWEWTVLIFNWTSAATVDCMCFCMKSTCIWNRILIMWTAGVTCSIFLFCFAPHRKYYRSKYFVNNLHFLTCVVAECCGSVCKYFLKHCWQVEHFGLSSLCSLTTWTSLVGFIWWFFVCLWLLGLCCFVFTIQAHDSCVLCCSESCLCTQPCNRGSGCSGL